MFDRVAPKAQNRNSNANRHSTPSLNIQNSRVSAGNSKNAQSKKSGNTAKRAVRSPPEGQQRLDHIWSKDKTLKPISEQFNTREYLHLPRGSSEFPWTDRIQETNHNIFGNSSFRPNQREVINSALMKEDCFVVMPTGGGKSLWYQLPAILDKGVTIVVSPLISLIKDQGDKLEENQISVGRCKPNMTVKQAETLYGQLENLKILIITPERIGKEGTQLFAKLDILYAKNMIARLVIDEAHCISKWGHDFRPDFRNLDLFRKKYSTVPITALTATATREIADDVIKVLDMKRPFTIRATFNRPNLIFSVKKKYANCEREIASFIKTKHPRDSGIVYCLSRKNTEEVAEALRHYGVEAGAYHAGLKNSQKINVQEQWMSGDIKVIWATIAFGMGIDKADVRFVIHHSLPRSLESYYQEAGRAGRDGLISECILYFSRDDLGGHHYLIGQGRHKYKQNKEITTLNKVVHYCENTSKCRRKLVLDHFGEPFDPEKQCQMTCDNCRSEAIYNPMDCSEQAKIFLAIVTYTDTYNLKSAKAALKYVTGAGKLDFECNDRYHGYLANMEHETVQQLINEMLLQQVIWENLGGNSRFTYYVPGAENKREALRKGLLQINVDVEQHQRRVTTAPVTGNHVNAARTLPWNQGAKRNPSKPIEHLNMRTNTPFAVAAENNEEVKQQRVLPWGNGEKQFAKPRSYVPPPPPAFVPEKENIPVSIPSPKVLSSRLNKLLGTKPNLNEGQAIRLQMKLKIQRKLIARDRNVADTAILSNEALVKLAEALPTGPHELASLKSIGEPVNPRFMRVIKKFLEDEGMQGNKRTPEVEVSVGRPGLRLTGDESMFSTFR